jgi:hypothetical protein
MKRLALLLLLATTTICYGQSSEATLKSIGSSDMSAVPVVTESSYVDELEQLDRQRNEAAQRHFDTITREEEIEAQQQPQQGNASYSPIKTKYNGTKQNKQHERSSAISIGQRLPDKYSTPYHPTASALHNSSKNDYHRPGNNVHQLPK